MGTVWTTPHTEEASRACHVYAVDTVTVTEAYNATTFSRNWAVFMQAVPDSVPDQPKIDMTIDGTELAHPTHRSSGAFLTSIRETVRNGEAHVLAYADADISDEVWNRVVENFRHYIATAPASSLPRMEIRLSRVVGGFSAFREKFPFSCTNSEFYKPMHMYPSLVFESDDGAQMFVSGYHAAIDPHVIRAVGITHVVNCTPDVPFADGVAGVRVSVHDTDEADMTPYLQDVFALMREAFENKQKVLVHCHQGISRSVSVAAGMVSFWSKCTVDEGLQQVKHARLIAEGARVFLDQIQVFLSESSCAEIQNSDV